MTSLPPDDAEAFVDLADDCREVSGVLSPYVPVGIRLPVGRPDELDGVVLGGGTAAEDG